MSAPEGWRDAIERYRRRKDEYFAETPRSPIPADDREGGEFEGLDYFEPDPTYRFELPLDRDEGGAPVAVETTSGNERAYDVVGVFRFELGGDELTLNAYRASADEEGLWVPFRDETNGEETYGGGRYLDLTPEDRLPDGRWTLDFNLAYNPFCAYSGEWECPLVPAANRLSVRIEAGEKAYG